MFHVVPLLCSSAGSVLFITTFYGWTLLKSDQQIHSFFLYAFRQLVQHLVGRELEPWETIAVGALSGGLAAVTTTPFDVIKTRMMTAPQGRPVSMTMVAFSILRREGPLGLFKGAVPRFFWIAPLGAMNFAGYELARKAMDKNEEVAAANALSQKKLTNSG